MSAMRRNKRKLVGAGKALTGCIALLQQLVATSRIRWDADDGAACSAKDKAEQREALPRVAVAFVVEIKSHLHATGSARTATRELVVQAAQALADPAEVVGGFVRSELKGKKQKLYIAALQEAGVECLVE